ncbi:uncharacterized protein Dana_GF23697 [Drosophila ananassae]|uniref:Uncharacterized protein n=1 Tax=Drosophila ananassae TaxID=7217 RepID=B3M716_DROAN|nr:uncharacterized protein LOC6506337 [Drosophila ananassae]EDV40881.1 uncharacterized protein Dana_GF23697 [Drosophila ananassae]
MNLSAILKNVSNSLGFGATTANDNQKKVAKRSPFTYQKSPYYSSESTSTTLSSTISSPSSISDSTTTPSSTSLSASGNSPFGNLLLPSEDEEQPTPSDSRLASAAAQLSKSRHPYRQIIEQILRQVSELEHTLFEDQQQEFKLRMALERQTERVQELAFSLDSEKQRNGRLVQLLRGVDTASSGESEPEERTLSGSHVKSIGDLYESISPLLMQQRYDELSISHRQSRRQLAKKEKALKLLKCEKEQLHSQYDQLFDEYRSEQKRFEMLCSHYIQMQMKKKQQIFNLKNTLGYASECIYHAQAAIDECCRRSGSRSPISQENLQNFRKNLDCFMDALRSCCCLQKVHELQQQQLQKQEKELKIDKHKKRDREDKKDIDQDSTPSIASSATYLAESSDLSAEREFPKRSHHGCHRRPRHSNR